MLDRDANGATVYGRGRDIEQIETAVEFNKEACRWFVIGEAAQVRRTDERRAILTILEDADEPMGPSDLAALTSSKNGNVRKLLHMMMKAGEVRKVGYGLYTHPRSNRPIS